MTTEVSLATKTRILFLYMSVWIACYIVVHSTAQVPVHPAMLVTFVETIKLVVATLLFALQVKRRTCERLEKELTGHLWPLFRTYLPVAPIYALYDNLSIHNLRYFDPSTYLVFLSFQLLLTAVVWKFTFNKPIAKWGSLALITVGVLIEAGQSRPTASQQDDNTSSTESYWFNVVLLVLQLTLAVVGSVYNEKVLELQPKRASAADSPHLHNMCLYAACVMTNIGFLVYSVPSTADLVDMWGHLKTSTSTIASIAVLALGGVMTSLVLRYLDSVTKAVATSLQTSIVAVVGYAVFGYHITFAAALSIVFVSVGSWQYAAADHAKVPQINFRMDGSLSRRRLSRLEVVFLLVASFYGLVCCVFLLLSSAVFTSEPQHPLSVVSSGELPPAPRTGYLACNSTDDWNKDHFKKWRAFQAAIEVFDRVGADYFVMAGTLLGFVRECRHFDKDIDLAVSVNWLLQVPSNKEKLRAEFIRAGFAPSTSQHAYRTSAIALDGEFMFKFKYEGLRVDVFFTYTDDDGYFENGSTDFNLQLELGLTFFTCRRPMLEGVGNHTWNGLTVRVPEPYHETLLGSYGPDYMTPKKSSFADDATHAIMNGRCTVATRVPWRPEEDGESVGIVACLTDRQSVIEALVLVQSLSQWGEHLTLELYYNRDLDSALQCELERYPFVSLVELPIGGAIPKVYPYSEEKNLYARALEASELRHVLLMRPSTVFLWNPLQLLETIRYHHANRQGPHKVCRDCQGKCVTTTHTSLTQTLNSTKGVCTMHTYPSSSLPIVVSKETTIQLASIHEVSHRVGVFLHPSRQQLGLVGSNAELEDALVLDEGPRLPRAYYKSLSLQWKQFRDAKDRLVAGHCHLAPDGNPSTK